MEHYREIFPYDNHSSKLPCVRGYTTVEKFETLRGEVRMLEEGNKYQMEAKCRYKEGFAKEEATHGRSIDQQGQENIVVQKYLEIF